jgi:phenylpropionate dioxygenase-like ring-hydroxylating dioxygenase large terminal subunit
VAFASDLGARTPLPVTLAGTALVLFRDERGRARALVDRCPHRAYPLSEGRLAGGELQCAYHGWRFDGSGACRAVPGLAGPSDRPERKAESRALSEACGVLWAWGEAGEAEGTPPLVIGAAADGSLEVRWRFRLEAALPDALENILDVPHTAFLHGGLFRNPGAAGPLQVRVSRSAGGLVADYVGEPAPRGLIGRVLAPGGGVVSHADRFLMPSVAQVDYGLGPRLRLRATTFLSPETDSSTRALTVVSVAPRSLAVAALPMLLPASWWLLRQDARALRLQSRNLTRHPGARYASTEADVLGPHLRQMLQRAARGDEPLPDASWTVGG